MEIIEKRKCEVTIRRPGGAIVHTKIEMTKGILAAVTQAEASDYKTRCTRCKSPLNTRTAWYQKEWMRLGGSKIQVDSYYCPSCKNHLSSIGQGEITDQEKRGKR